MPKPTRNSIQSNFPSRQQKKRRGNDLPAGDSFELRSLTLYHSQLGPLAAGIRCCQEGWLAAIVIFSLAAFLCIFIALLAKGIHRNDPGLGTNPQKGNFSFSELLEILLLLRTMQKLGSYKSYLNRVLSDIVLFVLSPSTGF